MAITDEVAELWASNDAVGFLRAWTIGRVPQGEHGRHTANRLVEVPRAGFVVMEWTPGPQLANLSGTVHGGYIALVCDEAGGLSCASTNERFLPSLTLDLDVTYLRPAVLGETHRVEGEVQHRGRQRVVSDVRVLRPDGKLAATARGSFLPNARFAERMAAGR
jgi:uncharacterized protein (TIGR00369 family)